MEASWCPPRATLHLERSHWLWTEPSEPEPSCWLLLGLHLSALKTVLSCSPTAGLNSSSSTSLVPCLPKESCSSESPVCHSGAMPVWAEEKGSVIERSPSYKWTQWSWEVSGGEAWRWNCAPQDKSNAGRRAEAAAWAGTGPGPCAQPDATSPGLLSPWLLLNTAPAVLKDQWITALASAS